MKRTSLCFLLFCASLAFGQNNCADFDSACHVGQDHSPRRVYLLEYATQDAPAAARQTVFEWFSNKQKALNYLNQHPDFDFISLYKTEEVPTYKEKSGKLALVRGGK